MTDHSEKIKRILSELHEELKSVEAENVDAHADEALDDETREQLGQMFHEIGDLLSHDSISHEQTDLASRLDNAAKDFQVTHPVLSGLLERTAQALASIGI